MTSLQAGVFLQLQLCLCLRQKNSHFLLWWAKNGSSKISEFTVPVKLTLYGEGNQVLKLGDDPGSAGQP